MKVIGIDQANRINLSIKKVSDPPSPPRGRTGADVPLVQEGLPVPAERPAPEASRPGPHPRNPLTLRTGCASSCRPRTAALRAALSGEEGRQPPGAAAGKPDRIGKRSGRRSSCGRFSVYGWFQSAGASLPIGKGTPQGRPPCVLVELRRKNTIKFQTRQREACRMSAAFRGKEHAMLIINGTVHTMEGLTIPGGYVEYPGGQDRRDRPPWRSVPRAGRGEVFDAQGGHIQPGFVDAHCHLGMFGDSTGIEGGRRQRGPPTPAPPTCGRWTAVNPMDRCFQEAREAGGDYRPHRPGGAPTPSAASSPPWKTNGPLGGRHGAQGPGGHEAGPGGRTPSSPITSGMRPPPPAWPPPPSSGRIWPRRWRRPGGSWSGRLRTRRRTSPDYDAKLDALLPVIRGELPVHIHAHRADDMATGIRICKEFGLKYVLVHGTDGHLIPDLLAQEGAGVITGPLPHRPLQAGADAPVPGDPRHPPALRGKGGHLHRPPGGPPSSTCPCAPPWPSGGGMDPESALACVTIRAAELAGGGRPGGLPGPGKGCGCDRHQRPIPSTGSAGCGWW